MAAIHVTAEHFKDVVLKADKPVLVDFWAQWCGPCQNMGPIVEEIADEYPDVMSIPTFLIFENGEVVKRTVGEQTKQELLTFVGK